MRTALIANRAVAALLAVTACALLGSGAAQAQGRQPATPPAAPAPAAPPPPQSTVLRDLDKIRAAAQGRRTASCARARGSFPRRAAARREASPGCDGAAQRGRGAQQRARQAVDGERGEDRRALRPAETARGFPRRAVRCYAAGGWRRGDRAPAVVAERTVWDADAKARSGRSSCGASRARAHCRRSASSSASGMS